MKYPKSKDVELKIKVILFTDKLNLSKLRDDIYEWAAEQEVNIFGLPLSQIVKKMSKARGYISEMQLMQWLLN